MIWWQWIVGVAEMAVVWWATDAITSPQARAKRAERRSITPDDSAKVLLNNLRQRPHPGRYRMMMCRYCKIRTAHSIYPNGVGPMCQAGLIDHRHRQSYPSDLPYNTTQPRLPGWNARIAKEMIELEEQSKQARRRHKQLMRNLGVDSWTA